jgi:hypothetical protein
VKTFLLFFLILATSTAQAHLKEIQSLNIDNCWVEAQSIKEKAVKWVNFSTGSVGQVENELLSAVADFVDQQYGALLKTGPQSYEGLFHCGSQQSSLVVNLDFGATRVCAWVRLDENNPKIERVGLEPLAHDGYCYGAVFKEAILTLENEQDRTKAMSFVHEKLKDYGVEVTDERTISSRVLVLSFSDAIMVAQEKILNELAQELKALGIARSLDLNYYQGEAGEFHPLD